MGNGFDWVAKRATCNVTELFNDLRTVVEANVKSAHQHVAPDVAFEEPATGHFVVTVPFPSRPDLKGTWRSFHLCADDAAIKVFGSDPDPMFVARANLVGDDCQLEVLGTGNGSPRPQPMRLWEFSRLVLEPVFFRGR